MFFDRNGNEAHDAGEPVRANGPGVWVTNLESNEKVTEVRTDVNGRYRVVLPKGPRYMVINQDKADFDLPWGARPTDKDMTLDFPLWGRFVEGFSFVDANGDGVKQADEKATTAEIKASGKTRTGSQVDVATTPAADGSYRFDLPVGDYTVTVPDLARQELALAKPLGANDIDWLTGQVNVGGDRNKRIDVRYFAPKADVAAEELTISPAKDTYTVGDQIDVRVKLTNKGDVPGKLSFILFGPDGNVLSHSENVTGANREYETVAKVLPGQSVVVDVKLELTSAETTEIWPVARPWIDGHKDVDRRNQGVQLKKTIKIVEKTTTTTPPSSSEPAASTTTTTTQAVAKAGNKTGLASTGASPLGFLALGSVLVAAGLSALFVARRRRS
ncbi:hypothetical protein GCM10027200_27130 [Lentzea nigeriaca]